MPARFFDQETKSRLRNKRILSNFLEQMIRDRNPYIKKIQLSYIFCTDAILHNINLQFLNHDDYTDIITFDLSEKPGTMTGEIYISIDRVTENARTFGNSYESELHRVIFHGALHLCGLGDKTEKEQKQMRSAEDAALEKWFATETL